MEATNFYLLMSREWKDRAFCLPCVIFDLKNVGKSLQKTIWNMTNSCKNIQNVNIFQQEHVKRHGFQPPLFLFEEGDEKYK